MAVASLGGWKPVVVATIHESSRPKLVAPVGESHCRDFDSGAPKRQTAPRGRRLSLISTIGTTGFEPATP